MIDEETPGFGDVLAEIARNATREAYQRALHSPLGATVMDERGRIVTRWADGREVMVKDAKPR